MKRLMSLVVLAPGAAMAHPGEHAHVGLMHLVTEPDHLAMLALAAGVVLVALTIRARR